LLVASFAHRWIVSVWDEDAKSWIKRADNGVPLSFEETQQLKTGTIVKVFASDKQTQRAKKRIQLSGVKYWMPGSHGKWERAHIVVK
jgi:hypothetical protein